MLKGPPRIIRNNISLRVNLYWPQSTLCNSGLMLSPHLIAFRLTDSAHEWTARLSSLEALEIMSIHTYTNKKFIHAH